MNTLTTINTFETKRAVSPRLVEQTPGKSGWYQGYEMGMAFCRLTEKLASEPGSKVEKELRCLECTLEQSFPKFCRHKSINLIDLGTGDGQKMTLVIEALNEAGIRSVRYIPVDTNPFISRYAIFTILGSGRKAWSKREVELLFGPLGSLDLIAAQNTDSISIETLVYLSKMRSTTSDLFVRNEVTVPMTGLEIDFFQNLPKVANAAKALNGIGLNLFCLLGNTFGNYTPEKQNGFLTTLFHQMKAGDLFLLGISLRPNGNASPDQICCLEREYLPGEAFMRLGADDPQSEYSSKYDPESHCVIHTFERADKSIQQMGFSYLFDAKEVIMDLDSAGFEVLSCESYPGLSNIKTSAQMECEPKYLTILARKPLT